MNLLLASLFVWLAIASTVQSQTTLAPNVVIDEQSRSEPEKSEASDSGDIGIEQSVPKKATEEVGVNPVPNSGPTFGPVFTNAQPNNQPHVPQWPPMPVLAPPHHAPFQVRVPPPFLGNLFKPSIIRSQSSSFVALPPKDQPIFDSFHCQQGSSSKRDLDSQRPLPFGGFYLNMKNQDVLFSICGSLAPAHRILIEPVSTKFEQLISALTKNGTNHDPIVINDISNLLDHLQSDNGTDSSTNSSIPVTNSCLNKEFETAFRLFLKFFYVGDAAFGEIQNCDVAFLVWRLGEAFLEPAIVQQQIEPRIGSLISLDTLGKVYRFATAHQNSALTKKWSEFITSNARVLAESDRLPLLCADINGDIEYLDRFIEALNVNQSLVISYIRQYLRTCPESANFVVHSGSNPFPRSLLYFRCTIDNLKDLVKIGFLNYETLAEELENRLRVNERHCEEKCAAKFPPHINPNFRHVMPLNLGATQPVGRRA